MDSNTAPRQRALRIDGLGLSPLEAFVFSRVDGLSTLADVADSMGIGVDQVVAIASRLETLGAIERPAANSSAGKAKAGGRYVDVAPSTRTRSAVRAPDAASLGRVPHRTQANLYSMKLETGDAFLVSNIDGRSSLQELSDVLGEDPARVTARVEALVAAGALELRAAPSPSASRARVASKAHEPASSPRRRSVPPRAAEAARPAAGRTSPPPRPLRSIEPARRTRSSRKLAAVSPSATGPNATALGSTAKASRPSRAPAAVASGEEPRVARPSLPRHPVLEPAKPPPRASVRPPPPPKDDSTCDLDPETCARIDAACVVSNGQTQYAILGVAPTATGKEISRAYFALAACLHPDRYFGKRLGPYKRKLEQSFRTVTDAYEMLRSASRRAEYDAYLGVRRKSVEIEAALVGSPAAPPASPAPPSPPPPSPPPVAALRSPSPVPVPIPSPPPVVFDAPRSVKIAVTSPAASIAAPPAVSISAPPRPSPVPEPRISLAPSTPRPSIDSKGESAGVLTARPSIDSKGESAGVLTARQPIDSKGESAGVLTARQPIAPRTSVRSLIAATKSASLLDSAMQALATGDAVSATNFFRLALEFAEEPGDRRRAEAGLDEARALVAEAYIKRARFEEKEARWSEAVSSYEKALDRRPDDPSLCERLANALRQDGQDLVRATRLAERAVARTSRNATCRRTLGLLYADAGLADKALEQFERAAELDPSDETTRRALAKLRGRR